MKQNNRFTILAATLVIVIIGLMCAAFPPHQIPSEVPVASDDETTR